jgi:uncharacterized pyridoxamine 5'-phosphate oxidase family protein
MEILNFETEKNEIYNKIGKNKLAALATSSQDNPTIRIMNIIFFDKKIYFQTGIDLMKYKKYLKI